MWRDSISSSRLQALSPMDPLETTPRAGRETMSRTMRCVCLLCVFHETKYIQSFPLCLEHQAQGECWAWYCAKRPARWDVRT
jgi:hypothetical protein